MGTAPLGLIIEPTRELATQVRAAHTHPLHLTSPPHLHTSYPHSHTHPQLQVYDEITKFKKYLTAPELTHQLFIGGVDAKEMMQALRTGCHIVIATPGRLMGRYSGVAEGKEDGVLSVCLHVWCHQTYRSDQKQQN